MISLGQITANSDNLPTNHEPKPTSSPKADSIETTLNSAVRGSDLVPTINIAIPSIIKTPVIPTPRQRLRPAVSGSSTGLSSSTYPQPQYPNFATPRTACFLGSVRMSRDDRARKGKTGDAPPIKTPRLTTPNLSFRSRSVQRNAGSSTRVYKSVRSVTNLSNTHNIFGSPSGGTRIPVMPSVTTPLLPLISSGISFDSYVDVQTPVIRTPKAVSARGSKGKGKTRPQKNYSRSVGRTPKPATSARADQYQYTVNSFFRANEVVPSDNSYIPTRDLYDRYLCWANQHTSKLKYVAFCQWLRSTCTIVKFRGTNHVQNYHILGTPFIRKGKGGRSHVTKQIKEYPLPAGHNTPLEQLSQQQIQDMAQFLETRYESLESAVRCGSYHEVWHQGQLAIGLSKLLTNMTSRRIEHDTRKRAGKPDRVLQEYKERYDLAQTRFQRAIYDLGVVVFKNTPYSYFTRPVTGK